jgi:NTP pyrophosphatase (non-canonical NTP hydrolase)
MNPTDAQDAEYVAPEGQRFLPPWGHLTFAQVTEANTTRCNRWHPGFPHDEAWTGADWSNAVCGEAGEMANVVKKLRRLETGTTPGPDDPPEAELRRMLADEIADVFTYLDLLATFYGVDIQDAIAAKFNRVSERQGFPDRLPARLAQDHPLYAQTDGSEGEK